MLQAYGGTQSYSLRVSTLFMILKYCLHTATGLASIERRYSFLGNLGKITYSLPQFLHCKIGIIIEFT